MAGEKLTKQKLVQIIIMLTILIIAFFWRTFNYDNGKTALSCVMHPSCEVKIGNEVITVTQSPDEPLRYTLSPFPEDWAITLNGEVTRQGTKVSVKSGEKPTQIIINDQYQITIIE